MNYCRWASSLGELEATAEEVWGTPSYNPKKHKREPAVFLGLYDLRDYLALWNHKGKRWILWAGSDLRNLSNEFIFNDGKLHFLSKIFRGTPEFFRRFLKDQCEHWVENEKEAELLYKSTAARANICPSFLGDIKGYQVSYKYSPFPNVYVSSGKNRQIEYGFEMIEQIAGLVPFVTFHLYGADWDTKKENITVHGRVSKEQMNEEIRNMQCGLRLNSFDGFSEITAKSILWGQYPITNVPHPRIPFFSSLETLIRYLQDLRYKHQPNLEVRDWYVKNLNNFPWNENYGTT